LLVLATLCVAAPASAQTLAQDQAQSDGSTSSSDGSARTVESGHELSDQQAQMEEDAPPPSTDDGISPQRDRENTDYFSFGFLARGVVVPDFMINAFVYYRGSNAVNAGMGGYFQYRRNGLNVIAEVWYAGFGQQGFFHGLNAADSETEYVNSQLGVIFGNFAFLWAIPVTEWLAIDVGIGLGIGGMMGNLYRQEAYPNATAQYGYSMCQGVGMPNAGYCEGPVERPGPTGRLDSSRQMGGTYQVQQGPGSPGTGPNPFYFGDGGVPPMFAWIDLPRVSARITPIRQLQIRVDLSYNIYAWSFGGSVGYAL
jgi:hypothetical protein